MSALPILMLVLPLVGAVVALAVPERARLVGVAASGVVFAVALASVAGFDYDNPQKLQQVTKAAWLPAYGISFHLGLDGISLPLVALTALLSLLCFVYTTRYVPSGGSPQAFVALLLLLETGMLGTFLAQDLILFFVFFETVLIPMYALIARWGGEGSARAAVKFILYTLLGSALMLVGFLVIYSRTRTFDMAELAARHGAGMTLGVQTLAFVLVALGFAVKTPMFPLHTWLPDAHTSAPTVGSVLLAGVLLKMGTYGFIRIGVAMLPLGAHRMAVALASFAVIGIIYGSLACLAIAQRRDGDLKRLIAYSSVGHMGFVLLGIASLTQVGINGALFANIAHGLITGLLFFLAGGLKERAGSTSLRTLADAFGGRGLYGTAPRYGVLLAFTALASLGLPGLAGFWGEVLSLYGASKPGDGLAQGTYFGLAAVAAVGLILTAAYFLIVVRRVCMARGEHEASSVGAVLDLGRIEIATWSPLIVLIVVAGLWPATLLAVTNPAVQNLLGGIVR